MREGTNWTLSVFDPAILSEHCFLGDTWGNRHTGQLIRYGVNGVAFCTSDNQLFLVQTPLIVPEPPADLAVTQALPASALLTSNITCVLTVTNRGPEQRHECDTGLLLLHQLWCQFGFSFSGIVDKVE